MLAALGAFSLLDGWSSHYGLGRDPAKLPHLRPACRSKKIFGVPALFMCWPSAFWFLDKRTNFTFCQTTGLKARHATCQPGVERVAHNPR